MTQENFKAMHPEVFFLDEQDVPTLESYLKSLKVIEPSEQLTSVERAGEGNMNLTVRVSVKGHSSGGRSLIVKQSRPWVEKFPEIEAPWERVLGEARFYLLASAHERVAKRLPDLIEIDPGARVMILEDLGQSNDFTGLYRGEQLELSTAIALAEWLSDLHGTPYHEKSRASLANLPMRRLNHEHLFRFPLQKENGLQLDRITEGLSDEAGRLIKDQEYRTRVAALGEIYLGTGSSLLHGDFFPGSWLKADHGPAIIDPEFAFFGRTEFDMGVLLAHLYLADQETAVHEAVIEAYQPSAGFDWRLALEFCAVEIMRRLIGVAQLPLSLDFESKASLLELSQGIVLAADPLQCEAIKARDRMIALANHQQQNDKRSA